MVRPGSDVVHTLKGEGFDASEDGTGRGTPLVPVVAKALMAHPGPTGRLDPEVETLVPVIAGTLKANNGGGGWSNSVDHAAGSYMVPVTVRLREGKEGGGKGPLVSEDQSLTLATANDQILAFDTQQITSKVNRTRVEVGMPAGTLTQHSEPHVAIESTMQVRRLTVRECERLMGFPDDYTLIPMPMKPRKQKRKESDESYADYLRRREDRCSADGPRYKALGNSWAVPCARWIGRQIHAITQASKAA